MFCRFNLMNWTVRESFPGWCHWRRTRSLPPNELKFPIIWIGWFNWLKNELCWENSQVVGDGGIRWFSGFIFSFRPTCGRDETSASIDSFEYENMAWIVSMISNMNSVEKNSPPFGLNWFLPMTLICNVDLIDLDSNRVSTCCRYDSDDRSWMELIINGDFFNKNFVEKIAKIILDDQSSWWDDGINLIRSV